MLRILIGGVAGGVVMFIISFILWATPLSKFAFASANDAQSAAVQTALAQNLPHTGRYVVPDPESPGGAVLYGRGPVATVDYNSAGFSTSDSAVMIGGLIHFIVVSLLIGFSLYGVSARVTDFESRARLVIGFAAAGTVLIVLSDPIWAHASWRYGIYALIAYFAVLCAGGLVVSRWFVPNGVRTPAI